MRKQSDDTYKEVFGHTYMFKVKTRRAEKLKRDYKFHAKKAWRCAMKHKLKLELWLQ